MAGSKLVRGMFCVCAGVLLGGCSAGAAILPLIDGRIDLGDVIASILADADGSDAPLVTSALPQTKSDLDRPLVLGEQETVAGGAVRVKVSNIDPNATAVLVFAVDVARKSAAPVATRGGYYKIPITQPVQEVPLSIAIDPEFAGQFNCQFAVLVQEVETEVISDVFDWPIVSRDEAVGDFQVTVAWDTDANLNLHVVDPVGDAIAVTELQATDSCGALISSSTGASTPRAENIGWATGVAPAGNYRVGVAFARRPSAQRETGFTITVLRRLTGADGSVVRVQTLLTGSFPFATAEGETAVFLPELDPVAYGGSPDVPADDSLCGSWDLALDAVSGDPACTAFLEEITVTVQQVGPTPEGATVRFVHAIEGVLWEGTRRGRAIEVDLPANFTVDGDPVVVDALTLNVDHSARMTGNGSFRIAGQCTGSARLTFTR